jgi:hypothetical protein
VSARRLRVTAILSVVLFAGACTESAAAPVARFARPTTTTTTDRLAPTTTAAAAGVPMVLETGYPHRPPDVRMVVQSHGRDLVQTGVLYTANFATRHAVVMRYSTWPVPWSAPSVVDDDSTPTILLGTPYEADSFDIQSYAHVDSFGLPHGSAVQRFECKRFAAPRCRFAVTGSGVRLVGVGGEMLTGGYLAVFVTWHVPSNDRQVRADATDRVVGSWLFRFAGKHPVRASQP